MWDVFCNVIDNYGDIGVSWRLARQLVDEHDIAVRLWVDDPGALQKLYPSLDADVPRQNASGIEVRLWHEHSTNGVEPGAVVIEVFGCQLPPAFLQAMAARSEPPLWLNLEYLSAEDWIAGCHRLPSPHPRLPLTKYFFFPGFTNDTGGLLREHNLFAARDKFRSEGMTAYWLNLGLTQREPNEIRISLFSYENAALPALLKSWEQGSDLVRLLVPEGRVLPQLCAYLDATQVAPGQVYRKSNLAIHVLPFSDQQTYDHLLWACDLNFVRGEDSFVRAQWAGRPFIWHIYPQAQRAHEAKLAAFLSCYCAPTSEKAASHQVKNLFEAWNNVTGSSSIQQAWTAALSEAATWQARTAQWANMLAGGPELATELVKFAQAQVKSRPFD